MLAGVPRVFDERKDHKLIYKYWETVGSYLQFEYGYENAYDWKEDIKSKGHTMIFDFEGSPGGILDIRLYQGIDGVIGRLYPYSDNPERLSFISQYGINFCFTPREEGGLNCKRVQFKEVRVETLVKEMSKGEYDALKQQYTKNIQGEHTVSASDSAGSSSSDNESNQSNGADTSTSSEPIRSKVRRKPGPKPKSVSNEHNVGQSNNTNTSPVSNELAVAAIGQARARRKKRYWEGVHQNSSNS